MNDTLTLFCLVNGDVPTDRVFSVKILRTNTVDELKKLIKTEKSPEFDDIVADSLMLWKVDICMDELEEFDPVNELETHGEMLSPMRRISKVFPDGVEDEHLHIIVVRPVVETSEELQESELSSDASQQCTFVKYILLEGYFYVF